MLYRLGRGSYRRRGIVLALWLVLLGVFGVGAATLSEPTSDEFALPGTEAQQGFDLLEERFPEMNADGAKANIVFAAPDGEGMDTPENRAAIDDTLAAVADDPDVAALQPPFEAGTVSEDGNIAYAQVQYTVQPFDLSEDTRELLDDLGGTTDDSGVRVEVGGSAMQPAPEPPKNEIVGLAVAAVVLTLALGSLVAAGLPLVTGLIGVGIGVAGVTAATAWFDLASETYMLALMLGLAVTIDYALFIITRFRHERSTGYEPEHAIARAVGTAGNAVVFAGAIVCITLVALSVVGIPFLTAMAVSAAATVAVAVLIAITLLPALVGFARNRISPAGSRGTVGAAARRAGGADGQHAPEGRATGAGLGERWGRFVTGRRVVVLLVAIPVLGALAWPANDLRLGMPDDSMAAPESTQRQAYELVAEGFGPGVNGPLLVAADVAGTDNPQRTVEELSGEISGLPGVAAVEPPVLDQEGDTALLTVIPVHGPSSVETEDLVSAIRALGDTYAESGGTALLVTGQTAMNIDISGQLGDAMVPYLLIVVGLALVLLSVVFRSLLIPVTAAAGFLFTVGATFGAVVAVFQWGWLDWLLAVDETGPIISMMPIFLVGVLFGLAMDYQLFLGTRMREEYVHGAESIAAVVGGFRLGARVVTAAAIIMVSVFAGFIFSDEDMIKSMGFALAFGVLIDAFVVRMTVIPALMSVFGRASWWMPRPLARVLPDADIEGERLTRNEPEPAPSGTPAGAREDAAPVPYR
nr:MMPL family transporter [Haloechinothrix aidingensis]